MTVTIQSNASGDWLDITTLSLGNTDTITLGINNTEAAAKTMLLWAAGIGNNAPANVVDRQGAEIVAEGWLECKLPADSVWVPLKFPASFPIAFADLAAVDGVFELTAGATARTLVNFRMNHAAGATTVGEAKFQLVARYLDA